MVQGATKTARLSTAPAARNAPGKRGSGLEQRGRETEFAEDVQGRPDINASGGGGRAGEHLGAGFFELTNMHGWRGCCRQNQRSPILTNDSR